MIEFAVDEKSAAIMRRGAFIGTMLKCWQGWEITELDARECTASDLRAIADKLDSLNEKVE